MIAAARLSVVAVCFAAGVLAADRLDVAVSWAMLAGFLGVSLLAVAWLNHRRLGEPRAGELLPHLATATIAFLVIGVFAIGFANAAVRSASLERGSLESLDGAVVTMRGTLVSDPVRRSRTTTMLLDVERVRGHSADTRVQLHAAGGDVSAALGDEVVLSGRVRALDPRDRFDRSLRRKGVTASVSTAASAISLTRPSDNPVLRAANYFRTQLANAAVMASSRADAGLLLGITIGDESMIPSSVTQDFRDTGLSHLTAVSGANLAMFLAALVLVMRLFRTGRRVQVAICIAAIAFFVVVTRWEPSVLRAALMSSVALGAFFFGRRSQGLHGLLLSFIVLVAVSPSILWSIGFQLSFAASLGILLLSPLIASRLGRLPRPIAEAIAVGVGAQLAVLPLLAVHFQRVSAVAMPANLLAFPLVAPATNAGLAAGAIALVSPKAASIVLVPADICVATLRRLAHLFASIPGATVDARWDLITSAAFYLLIVAGAFWMSRGRRAARWPAAIAAALWSFSSLAAIAGQPSLPADAMQITFLDVGQGDAALVESPSGVRVLIDGGPASAGVAHLLSRRGVNRVDVVVMSHAHKDHAEGLIDVIDRHDPSLVLDPGVDSPLAARVRSVAGAEIATDGERFTAGDLTIDVLGPSEDARSAAAPSADGSESDGLNDASLVVRIRWRSACAIFTGDVEEGAQADLVERNPAALRCTVMKAPHHGSGRILQEFVDAVDPEVVAVSVGGNSFGHPTPKALAMFERVGARTLRTDRLGDIVLRVGADGSVRR